MAYISESTESAPKTDVLWTQFSESGNVNEFAAAWLALLCASINGVTGALLLMGKPDQGPYSPIAVWPDPSRDLKHLVPAAEKALAGRRGVLVPSAKDDDDTPPAHHIAYPHEVSGKIHGVTVMEIPNRPEYPEAVLQGAMRQMYWSGSWIEILVRRSSAEEDRVTIERLASLLDLTAHAVKNERFRQSAVTLVNELASRLNCDRVSLGIFKRSTLEMIAISNTSKFQKRSNLVRETLTVMEEAIDQQGIVVSPQPPQDSEGLISRLHSDFVKRHELAGACTIPLQGRTDVFGALFFERSSKPFEPETLKLMRSMGFLLGPIMETLRQQERWFATGLPGSILRGVRQLLGPEKLILKACLVGAVAVICALAIIHVEYRVSSKTVIEGAIQRTIAAPFNSYVATADTRVSDIVTKGQVLCTLDNRDLVLEKRKWETVGDQYSKKYRQSLATHEHAAAQISDAQVKQAEAEAGLLNEKLVRSRVVAPFDGVLISGDLHQRIGSPVQQGEELFKIAPLDNYRVIIQVDERDLTYVQIGQKGMLILTSLPDSKFPFHVKRITPVSTSEEGKNYFRVEAQLDQSSNRLRPGMEGIGKVETGSHSLLWIWTHDVVNWIILKLWSWTP